jgi:protein-S-isoprenylcysteine O-methyltransferase Ste14
MSWPVKLLSVVIGTLAYLALAVIGWDGLAAFFSNPARTALVAVAVVLSVAGLFVGGNLSSGIREDRGNRWVLIAFTIISILHAWLPAYTDRVGFWTIDGDTIRWIGVILAAVGGALRLWPVYVLGNRFSGLVAIQEGHTLVTTGIYSAIRNPSYLGLLINMVGWSLAFRSVAGVLLTALMLIPLIARMNSEERLLQSQFGAEYDAYRARTSRLVPGLY